MEIGKKLLELRKKNNFSQEQLAEKLGVARQTISKWELGETSPDLKEAKELAKIFNVSLDELVGNNTIHKKSNIEKMASIFLIHYKISLVILLIFIIIITTLIVIRSTKKDSANSRIIEESIYCTLYGEEHGYSIKYDEESSTIIAKGKDSYFNDILDLDKYHDVHQIFNIINDYVKKSGGDCEIIKDRNLSDIVSIEIKDLTSTDMRIIIHDDSINKIAYGEDFYIEKVVDGHWEEIETTGENYGFNAIAYYKDENGLLEMHQNWEHIYGSLPKGRYRIVKNVFFDSDIPVDKEDIFYISEEFIIE